MRIDEQVDGLLVVGCQPFAVSVCVIAFSMRFCANVIGACVSRP